MKHTVINIIALLLITTCANASADEKDVETFFADPKHQRGFEAAVKSGKLKQVRTEFVDACLTASARVSGKGSDAALAPSPAKAKEICDCYSVEIQKIPDKILFYETVTSYYRYQERYQAAQERDFIKLERLKKEHAKQNTYSESMRLLCGDY